MSFSTSLMSHTDAPIVYLAGAAACLLVGLAFLKRTLAPFGPLLRAMAAATVVTVTTFAALAMVAMAALTS
ncbi:hypothetical protein [Actinoplanes subglobosus]|uniref:Uncharacterized protein n=1 Tax=Actinoplanes subglobosus TaxID=1547892 RepID=A0ABV8IVW6_9ACTN